MQNYFIAIYKNGICKIFPKRIKAKGIFRLTFLNVLKNDRTLGAEIDAADGVVISWLPKSQEELFRQNQGMITTIELLLKNIGCDSFEIQIIRLKLKGHTDGEIAAILTVDIANVVAKKDKLFYRFGVTNFEVFIDKLFGGTSD